MTEPRWLTQARKYAGEREQHASGKINPNIQRWWKLIGAPFHDDATPWCAGFVGGVLEEIGISSSHNAMAISYRTWGQRLAGPAVGAIVVFPHHVGFVVRRAPGNRVVVFGGNQSDMVKESSFSMARVVSYRWPAGETLPGAAPSGKDATRGDRTSLLDTPEGDEAPDGDADTEAPAPAPATKSGITEAGKAAAGLGITGVLAQVWSSIGQVPDSILQALIHAAARPSFWLFAAVIGAGAFIWWSRARMKKAAT